MKDIHYLYFLGQQVLQGDLLLNYKELMTSQGRRVEYLTPKMLDLNVWDKGISQDTAWPDNDFTSPEQVAGYLWSLAIEK